MIPHKTPSPTEFEALTARLGLVTVMVSLCAFATVCQTPAVRPVTQVAPTHVAAEVAPAWSYVVRVDEGLTILTADVCFAGFAPERIIPSLAVGAPLLRSASIGATACRRDDGAILVEQPLDGACLTYEVDLDRAASSGDGRRGGAGRVGDDLIMSPDLWLWLPEPRPAGVLPEVRFELPVGVQVAVPWPKVGDRYQVPASHFEWSAAGALGRFRRTRLTEDAGELDLVFLGEAWGERDAVITELVQRAARATTTIWGRLPTERAQILLLPRGDEAFGYALRGGGDSLVLTFPANFDRDGIRTNWTAVHELLHLGFPAIETADAWFFEGYVTYFAAVARARVGWISERAAWWELLDGFQRGRARGSGKTLRAESAAMRETHEYWRVYWSGAAIAFETDVRLRRGGGSLDAALRALWEERMDPAVRWRAKDMLARLDAHAGQPVPSSVAKQYLDRTTFPDVDAVLTSLGLTLASEPCRTKPCEGLISYDDDAPDAAIRQAIMKPR